MSKAIIKQDPNWVWHHEIVCDCMIIRVGVAGCLLELALLAVYVRGACLFIVSSVCAKAPLDLNGSIIWWVVKASFQTSNIRSLLLSHAGLVICKNWNVINGHIKQCAAEWKVLNTWGLLFITATPNIMQALYLWWTVWEPPEHALIPMQLVQ